MKKVLGLFILLGSFACYAMNDQMDDEGGEHNLNAGQLTVAQVQEKLFALMNSGQTPKSYAVSDFIRKGLEPSFQMNAVSITLLKQEGLLDENNEPVARFED